MVSYRLEIQWIIYELLKNCMVCSIEAHRNIIIINQLHRISAHINQ